MNKDLKSDLDTDRHYKRSKRRRIQIDPRRVYDYY